MSNEELTEIFLKYLKPENKKRQVDINKLRVLCISELYDKYYKDKNKNCMISAKDAKKIIELIYYKLFLNNYLKNIILLLRYAMGF